MAAVAMGVAVMVMPMPLAGGDDDGRGIDAGGLGRDDYAASEGGGCGEHCEERFHACIKAGAAPAGAHTL
jgi:hypothetical protein